MSELPSVSAAKRSFVKAKEALETMAVNPTELPDEGMVGVLRDKLGDEWRRLAALDAGAKRMKESVSGVRGNGETQYSKRSSRARRYRELVDRMEQLRQELDPLLAQLYGVKGLDPELAEAAKLAASRQRRCAMFEARGVYMRCIEQADLGKPGAVARKQEWMRIAEVPLPPRRHDEVLYYIEYHRPIKRVCLFWGGQAVPWIDAPAAPDGFGHGRRTLELGARPRRVDPSYDPLDLPFFIPSL